MKIAFLGKGGSGKSTMATAFTEHLLARGMRVLAIDADHNMDFTYNLGLEPTVYLGTDPDMIKEYLNVPSEMSFREAMISVFGRTPVFSLFPADPFTDKISIPRGEQLRVITAGPHTERVRSQEVCSHSLAAPLKVYLPLLSLSPGEAVVIDERAGTDPVATGILNHVDLVAIVREKTVHSMRVAEQIRTELEHAGIPYLLIENKIHGIEKDTEQAREQIRERVAF